MLLSLTIIVPTSDAWRHGTCGVTSWTPAEDDCVCEEKGSIQLPTYATTWKGALTSCFAACHNCTRCRFVSVSLKWKDCSWFTSCNEVDTTSTASHDFRTYHVRSVAMQSPAFEQCQKTCGFHRDCKRRYTVEEVISSASSWDPTNISHAKLLERRAMQMSAACRNRNGNTNTAALRSGGWCLGPLHHIQGEQAGVLRSLPDGHLPADLGIVDVLLTHVLPKSSGGFYSLNDFGAGVGQYGRELLAREPTIMYMGYDGAGNVVRRTQGFVKFFDLTIPLSLPLADWLLCLEVGEHVPHQDEEMLVRNLHVHNRCGIILSWAPLDRVGLNHINNHDVSYIRNLFLELNYTVDTLLTATLRQRARHWMKDHLFAFRRRDRKCVPLNVTFFHFQKNSTFDQIVAR